MLYFLPMGDSFLRIDRRRFLKGTGFGAIAALSLPELWGRRDTGKIYYVSPTGNDANPGTIDRPWATLNKATTTLQPGDTVYLRGGTYGISQQILPQNSGLPDRWITYAGYPGEIVEIDARDVYVAPPEGEPPFPHDGGTFEIRDQSYIRIQNLTIKNSHNAGFTVRDSHHIDFYNNTTINTYSSGIAIWDGCHDHKVLGNTVINANTLEMRMVHEGFTPTKNVGPHEAISMGGVIDFEVAYNQIAYCQKEGIDCKRTCTRGKVHHNYVHDLRRQGLYIDVRRGLLEDIEMYENVVHDCEVGIAIGAEDDLQGDHIRIHHNIVYRNRATGIFLARWGKDRLRRNLQIYNNTVYHNGYGTGQPTHWLMGGLYLYTTNLENVTIENNIFSENKAFQIGYTQEYAPDDFSRKNILIRKNLIFGDNSPEVPVIMTEIEDEVYATNGDNPIFIDPLFADANLGDFRVESGADSLDLGAIPTDAELTYWWTANFPPKFSVE
jgi:Right handed beta helix region/Disaggregatase related